MISAKRPMVSTNVTFEQVEAARIAGLAKSAADAKYGAQVKAGLITDDQVLTELRAEELAAWEQQRTLHHRGDAAQAPRPRVR